MIDQSKDQSADIEPQGACITKPETCGAAGAAVAFWVRNPVWGVISSRSSASSSGFNIFKTDASEL